MNEIYWWNQNFNIASRQWAYTAAHSAGKYPGSLSFEFEKRDEKQEDLCAGQKDFALIGRDAIGIWPEAYLL